MKFTFLRKYKWNENNSLNFRRSKENILKRKIEKKF